MYPNLVEMNPTQVETLRFLVDQKRPAIPFYVCTIKSASTVEGSSRMVNNYSISKDVFASLYVDNDLNEVLHLIICSTSTGSLPSSTSRGICTFQIMTFLSLTVRDIV